MDVKNKKMKVLRFPMLLVDEQRIQIQQGAELLTVYMGHDYPCIWARVDTDAPTVIRRFLVRGDGQASPGLETAYVGTFQVAGGRLVFHVFDGGEEE